MPNNLLLCDTCVYVLSPVYNGDEPMITNYLLEENEREQKQLAEEEAQYDVFKYMENTHKNVLEAQAKYGPKLRYGQRAETN